MCCVSVSVFVFFGVYSRVCVIVIVCFFVCSSPFVIGNLCLRVCLFVCVCVCLCM